jgi:murein DD-endopeptidase MepM/ murein hydrolase activator NlpD
MTVHTGNQYRIINFFKALVTGAVLAIAGCNNPPAPADKKQPAVTAPNNSAANNYSGATKFGIPVDSFNVIEKTIQRNEFLATILEVYHVNDSVISALAAKSKPVFDVRRMAAGRQYAVFCSKDSLEKASYFVYQPNAIDYIVYDLRDSIRIYTGKREVTTRMLTASGTIQGSLYETFEKAGADPALAMKMADIYAWTIDFYSIRQGDWFKVMYEQRYVKDEPIEFGAIQSAVFSHNGETFYAFYYEADSVQAGDYYDEHGKSLRKAFLKAPLKFSRITSRYTMKRFHPVQKRWKAHLGTDYGAPYGTPIIATGNGVVTESRFTSANGNYVKIKHSNIYTTQYLHMRKRAVRAGQAIRQGQVIGYVGSTGLATGPHVCYRFWKNGKQVDPLRQKFPAAIPIPDEGLSSFQGYTKEQQTELNNISL